MHMTDKKPNRFDIDDKGYRQLMMDVEPYKHVNDMMQNCLDEDSITNFQIYIRKNTEDGLYEIKIDDNGDGFRKKSDVYTLFGDSYKRADRTKIGRYNEGEKKFFAVCEEGELRTKDMEVIFPKDGGRIVNKLQNEVEGTHIKASFAWSKKQIDDILKSLSNIIVGDKKFMINGESVEKKTVLKSFKTNLWTIIEDDEKKMVRRLTETNVQLYEIPEGDEAWLYEIGIPVCKLVGNISWNVNVGQKIPQTSSRDVISEAYLKDLYGAVLNNAVDLLNEENSSSTFVQIGMKSASENTAKQVLKNVYGTEDVYIQSTDPDSNEDALDSGGQLVKRGMFDQEAKQHLEEIGVLRKASDVFGKGTEIPIPLEPTKEMLWFAKIVRRIALDVLEKEITNDFVKTKRIEKGAWYGGNNVTWNTSRLPKNFFHTVQVEQTKLIIHELAHDRSEVVNGFSHYTHEYIDETIRIGAIISQKGVAWYIDWAKNN